MSDAQPLLLISHPVLEPLRRPLEAAGFRVVLDGELADADRAQVRAVIHSGVELAPGFLEALPAVGLVANVGAGYEGVDVGWCRARGIEVTHGKGLNAEDVADHALGLLIASWREIAAGDREVREGRWSHHVRLNPRSSLKNRALGIVGLGAIGEAAARRAEPFGMRVAWWGPNPKPAPWPRAATLLDLARDSDILIVACRADASNRGLISQAVIEAVGPQGLIVNVARGSVVDEDALIAALKDGRLGRAALDVFAEEPTPPQRWADVPNVVLTPHTAGATADTLPRMVAQLVENIRLFLAGEPVVSPVAV